MDDPTLHLHVPEAIQQTLLGREQTSHPTVIYNHIHSHCPTDDCNLALTSLLAASTLRFCMLSVDLQAHSSTPWRALTAPEPPHPLVAWGPTAPAWAPGRGALPTAQAGTRGPPGPCCGHSASQPGASEWHHRFLATSAPVHTVRGSAFASYARCCVHCVTRSNVSAMSAVTIHGFTQSIPGQPPLRPSP